MKPFQPKAVQESGKAETPTASKAEDSPTQKQAIRHFAASQGWWRCDCGSEDGLPHCGWWFKDRKARIELDFVQEMEGKEK